MMYRSDLHLSKIGCIELRGCAGTTRLQLQHKGDTNYTYTDLANILPCAGILTLPIVSWLLDKKVGARRHLGPRT